MRQFVEVSLLGLRVEGEGWKMDALGAEDHRMGQSASAAYIT
jgi:hypothetical protein